MSTVSGDIEIKGLNAKGLEISMVSGDLECSDIKLDNDFNLNTVSGDVEMNEVKVDEIKFRSVSGDFEGSEVYCKNVQCRTVSGDFEINNSNHDEEIVIISKRSVSGNITIN